jgi:hypothetical protein
MAEERTMEERIERLQQWVDATSPGADLMLDREIVEELFKQIRKARYEIRRQKTKLRRLDDDFRCDQILGMATGAFRCYHPKGHEGGCLFSDPVDALRTELRRLKEFGIVVDEKLL